MGFLLSGDPMAQKNFLKPPIPDVLAQWRHYLSTLAPGAGDRVLDVGCGTGDADQLLLRIYPEVVEVIGLEPKLEPYAEAHRQAKAESARIDFRAGDAQDLPFADASFDRVLCVDTLEWVADPLLAVQEMQRVMKPGGVALIIHSDFDTQVFNASDIDLNRRIVHAFNDAGPKGQIGRELPGLCRQAGISVEVTVYPLVNTAWQPNLYGYRVAHMMVRWLREKELIPVSDLQSWLDDLAQQHERGTFFYSINRVLCRCTQ
jgi:ubiquinone/menaquinone biosynthesis C-methylase UbiE